MTSASSTIPADSWAETPGVRRSMRSNRHADTGPEIRLRSALHKAGARFRKNCRIQVNGRWVRPDIVFTRRRLAVFVDGCFWHRCPDHGSDPRRNGEFWKSKLDGNVVRDREADAALLGAGWTVMRFWEHEPVSRCVDQILAFLAKGVSPSGGRLTAFDCFSGLGGLTLGLQRAGFEVVGALDVSELAVSAYRLNHPTIPVIRRDIRKVDPTTLMEACGLDGPEELDLLAGCPPCQGFSRVRTRSTTAVDDPRNALVAQFARLAEALRPKALLMENVPALAQDSPRFQRFVRRLWRFGYDVDWRILNAADHGVPQRRRRLVLMASLGGEVPGFASGREEVLTVRSAISGLPEPHESDDPVHNHGENRSTTVMKRIKSVPHNGGSFRSSRKKQLACHKDFDGFYDIYGRMAWDQPSPTITGGCINPSKGRFLHPEQDRAITLREAAILQGFPSDYKIPLTRGKYQAAALVGNALPPDFVADHAAAIAHGLQLPAARC